MKKFIGGLIVGHIATNLLYLWTEGGFDRVKEIVEYYQEHPGETVDAKVMFSYILHGGSFDKSTDDDQVDQDAEDGEALHRWYQRIQRIRSMAAEGYSSVEIADMMKVSVETIQSVLEPPNASEEVQ